MSRTKDWFISMQPELERGESSRLRKMEEEYYYSEQLREIEEIELLNTLLSFDADNYEPEVRGFDVAPVASHSCTVGNSIQQ